jgi:hypothetical protein
MKESQILPVFSDPVHLYCLMKSRCYTSSDEASRQYNAMTCGDVPY